MGSSAGNGSRTGSARRRREAVYKNVTWERVMAAEDLPF